MFVILEGVDCTGKTTLAEALTDGVVPTLHRGPPQEHPLVEYALCARDLLQGIFDRWHIGERVWPRVFNRLTVYDFEMNNWVESFLLSRGAVLVHCTGKYDDVSRRIREREEQEPAYDVNEVLQLFERRVKQSILPTLTHTVEDPLRPKMVEAFAFTHSLGQSMWRHLEERCVGNWNHPWVWLVGDQPKDDVDALPFVPYPGTSGHYLFGLHLPWHDVAVSNSLDVDLRALWRYTGEPHTVALGTQAHLRLTEAGVPHGVVPHPQYVRRFHYPRNHEYTSAILAARNGDDLRNVFK